MSSRHPLASLSTRTGRLRSRANDRLQRGRAGGGGGGGGARTVTVVVADANLPKSSRTLHVTVTMPTETPPVPSVAVVSLALPPVQHRQKGISQLPVLGTDPTRVIAEVSPGFTWSGLATQVMVGGSYIRTAKDALQPALCLDLFPSVTAAVTV